MSSHDPERGCGLILVGCSLVVLVVDLLIGWLVDWRLPILWHVASVIIVLLVLLKIDLDERNRRR